jgi:hypothetical protein
MARRIHFRPTLLLAAAALAMAGPAGAKPSFSAPIRDKGSCYVLTTYNQTPKGAWITVYDLAKSTAEGDVTIGDQSGYLDVTSSPAASLSFTFKDMP